jgi:hypothetical protein
MRKLIQSLAIFSLMAFVVSSCKKEARDTAKNDEISASTLAQLKALGFNTYGAQKVAEGYLVEGDIIITPDQLTDLPTSNEVIYANEEHYRTTNLVSTNKYPVIKVALSTSSAAHTAAFTAALDEAIARYNAENLTITFQRVSSGEDITIDAYYQVSNVLGSAGFPSKTGRPYNRVKMNTYWYSTGTGSTNVNYIATIMAHEMGHCIGFRHTDYMNRSYSCGGSAVNEGASNVGAVYIPGTPTGPSASSWMLACSDGSNRPFTSADKVALGYVY